MIEAHLELAREVLPRRSPGTATARRARRSRATSWPQQLGIEPGPELGRLLDEIEAARVHGRGDDAASDAIELARTALRSNRLPPSHRTRLPLLQDRRRRLPAEIVDSDEHTVAFMDIAPATAGHALVIPREHYAEPARDPRRRARADDARGAPPGARGCEEALEPDGFNILNSCGPAAWQTVFHFHVHVSPLRRRPAEAAVGPGGGRPARRSPAIADRDPGGRLMADRRSGSSARAPWPRWSSPTRRSTCSPTTPSTSSWTCLDEVEGSDARALVWRAEGDIFTGGVDVNAFQRIVDADSPEAASGMAGPLIEGVQRLEALEIPTLALIHGLCLTAGLEVALGCDLIWAEESSKFGLVEAVVGLTPGAGGTQRMADRAGPARAREFVMTARPLRRRGRSSAGASINRVVPDGTVHEKGMRFAAAARERADEGARGDEAHRQGRLRRRVEHADEVTPEPVRGAVRDRGPAERGPLVPCRGARESHFRGQVGATLTRLHG